MQLTASGLPVATGASEPRCRSDTIVSYMLAADEDIAVIAGCARHLPRTHLLHSSLLSIHTSHTLTIRTYPIPNPNSSTRSYGAFGQRAPTSTR